SLGDGAARSGAGPVAAGIFRSRQGRAFQPASKLHGRRRDGDELRRRGPAAGHERSSAAQSGRASASAVPGTFPAGNRPHGHQPGGGGRRIAAFANGDARLAKSFHGSPTHGASMTGPLCPRRQLSFWNSRPADSFTFLVQSVRISRVSPVTEARSAQ